MCNCAETVKTTLERLIRNRNDAYKAYQQYEGAVATVEQLIPLLFPIPTTESSPNSEVKE